ncbi:MAG: DODA-type extradiol aromatic ring-opening family dioxygenase [Planctomycetota bacterium]
MTAASFPNAFSGLMPHPPIVIPDVGRGRVTQCQSTHDACVEFARRLVAARPERLFLVSPHAPRHGGAFGLWAGRRLRGHLGDFGAPEAAVDLPNDEQTALYVHDASRALGVRATAIPAQQLDHGSVVPLWFLVQAGWDGPTCIASLPWESAPETLRTFGGAVAIALGRCSGPSALVASGDMTHRAKPGAPGGYHKRAVDFDHELTGLVREGQLEKIADIDRALRELASEDAADSSMVVAAALGHRPHGNEVLSYEHPFGVGYLVAVFHDGGGEEVANKHAGKKAVREAGGDG